MNYHKQLPVFYEHWSKENMIDLQLFAGEKTEDPTQKRMSEAHNKGQVARSQDLSAAIVILVGFLAIWTCGTLIYQSIIDFTIYIFHSLNKPINIEWITNLFIQVSLVLAKTLSPIMIAVLLSGLMLNYYQVGFIFSTEPLSFDLSKLNPIKGISRIFSKRSLMELFKSFAKIFVVFYFVYSYIVDQVIQMPKLIFISCLIILMIVK